LFYGGIVKLNYWGNTILSGSRQLEKFSNFAVANNLPVRYNFPGRIQSENFSFNNGFVSETCTDTGGGLNMGFANPGDYMDYLVNVPVARHYNFNFRVASLNVTSQIIIRIGEGNSFTAIDTVTIAATGGWQTWKTVSSTAYLPAGRYTLRYYVRSGEFNSNWFETTNTPVTSLQPQQEKNDLQVYPNPAGDFVNIDLTGLFSSKTQISICNVLGQTVKEFKNAEPSIHRLDVSELQQGLYYIGIKTDDNRIITSILIIQ
jgi:hypothetical protein